MDDLEDVKIDASVNETEIPSKENETQDSIKLDTPPEEEEKTLEQLQEEIKIIQEKVINEEDATQKRHLQQDIGWKTKIVKEREKAKSLEEKNSLAEERLSKYETSLVEAEYSKVTDENYGLPYFEKLYKSNPDIAEKVASKWDKTAKQLIFDTKQEMADGGDEELQEEISKESLRESIEQDVYHKIAIEQADTMFESLEGTEKIEAKEYFDDIIEGKKLTPTKAKKYAEMATFYATRNRKTDKPDIDKDRILAGQASTGISPKSGSKETIVGDTQAIRQQLINSGIPRYQIDLMYPLN